MSLKAVAQVYPAKTYLHSLHITEYTPPLKTSPIAGALRLALQLLSLGRQEATQRMTSRMHIESAPSLDAACHAQVPAKAKCCDTSQCGGGLHAYKNASETACKQLSQCHCLAKLLVI